MVVSGDSYTFVLVMPLYSHHAGGLAYGDDSSRRTAMLGG